MKNVNNEDYKEKLNESEKLLLKIEWVLGAFTTLIFIVALEVAALGVLPLPWSIAAGVLGFILFAVGIVYCLKIEQITGFYECPKCGHKYVPSFKTVLWGMHNGRTRYMKCPKCGERSWQKKVLS